MSTIAIRLLLIGVTFSAFIDVTPVFAKPAGNPLPELRGWQYAPGFFGLSNVYLSPTKDDTAARAVVSVERIPVPEKLLLDSRTNVGAEKSGLEKITRSIAGTHQAALEETYKNFSPINEGWLPNNLSGPGRDGKKIPPVSFAFRYEGKENGEKFEEWAAYISCGNAMVLVKGLIPENARNQIAAMKEATGKIACANL